MLSAGISSYKYFSCNAEVGYNLELFEVKLPQTNALFSVRKNFITLWVFWKIFFQRLRILNQNKFGF